jgi:hypothetical protein
MPIQDTSKPIQDELWIPNVALCVLSFLLFFSTVWFASSKYGIGLSPDSATYLSVAQNLKDNFSLLDHSEKASSHFPPGYSAMIATTSLLTGRDVRHGAPRLLSATLFGILGATSILLLQNVNASVSIQGLAMLLMLGFRPLLTHAALATSELPFLTALAVATLFFLWWLNTKKTLFLAFTAILCGIFCLTRYVGIVWPIAFFLTGVIFQKHYPIRKRFLLSLGFTILAYLPLLTWLFSWKLYGPGDSARSIAWHPISYNMIKSGIAELSSCISIATIPSSILFIAALLIVCLLTRRYFPSLGNLSTTNPRPNLELVFLLGLSTFGYIIFLVISISFLDRATPLDGRILLPATWSIMMILLVLLQSLQKQIVTLRAVYFVLIFSFFWARFLLDSVPLLADLHREGIDLARPEILYNKTLDFIRTEIPKEKVVFSNTPWTVSLVSKRNVRYMPSKTDYTSGVGNRNYELELREITERVKSGDAILVIDTLYSDAVYDPPTEEEIEETGLIADPNKSTERFRVYGVR